MTKLVLIAAIGAISQGAFAQEKEQPRAWADQVVCEAEYTYFDYSAENVIQSASSTLLYELGGKPGAPLHKTIKLDKVGMEIATVVSFTNREEGSGEPTEEKFLYASAKLIENNKIVTAVQLYDKVMHTEDRVRVEAKVSNPKVENIKFQKGESFSGGVKRIFPAATTVLWNVSISCDAMTFKRQPPKTDF